MRKFAWVRLCLWLACASTPAIAQNTGTLTLTVNGLRSDKGTVAAALCSGAGGQFPGPCGDYSAISPAKEGTTTLTFTGVSAGSYEGAGHWVFVGDPTRPAAQAMAKAPPNAMLGGTGAANAAAWADNWPKTLAFFDKALKRTR